MLRQFRRYKAAAWMMITGHVPANRTAIRRYLYRQRNKKMNQEIANSAVEQPDPQTVIANGSGADIAPNEEIEPLYCTICTKEIPPDRARRRTSVCSEACKDKADYRRMKMMRNQKCPHCLHPSTPEEREDFRQWRIEKRGRRTKRGNPKPREAKIQTALIHGKEFLCTERNRLLMLKELSHSERLTLAEIEDTIEDFEKLIDSKPKT